MLNRGNCQDCEKRRASVMKIRNDLSQSGEHDGKTGFKALYFKCTASNTKIGRVAGSVNRTVQSVEFVIKVRQYSFVPPPPDFALGSQVRASASAKRLMPS
jgi:hypothetical protein